MGAQISSPARADEALQVKVKVSDRRVTQGDTLTVRIQVEARARGSISLEIPDIQGLTELSRSRGEQTSFSFGGGQRALTRSQTVTIEYRADAAGTITYPKVIARSGRQTAEARSFTIQVLEPGKQAATGPAAAPGHVRAPSAEERNLFVRYRIDKHTAYRGEQVLLDYEIYVDPVIGLSVEDASPPPTLDGFWREIIDQPQQLERDIKVINGRRYYRYRIWQVALFSLEAGTKTIPGSEAKLVVGRSLFNSGQRYRRRSDPITLEIKPLPTLGRPADFSTQNIGAYDLTAVVDRTKVTNNKAVELTLRLKGRGNIKNVRFPEITEIPGFRVFPPTLKDQVQNDDRGLFGEKIQSVLLVPKKNGSLEIPSVSISTFNPETGKYKRLTTEPIAIQAEGISENTDRAEALTPAMAPVSPSEPLAGLKLRPIRFRSTLASRPKAPWKQPKLGLLLVAPPILYLIFSLLAWSAQRLRQTTPQTQSKAALRHARTRLKHAQALAKSGETVKAHQEFAETLLEVATQKIGTPLRGLTQQEIQTTLTENAAPEGLVSGVVKAIETADYLRFAPGLAPSDEHRAEFTEWQALMSLVERWTTGEQT